MKLPTQRQVAKALEIAGEIAPIIGFVAAKNPVLRSLSVGIKAAQIGARLYSEFASMQGHNPYHYFVQTGSTWVFVPKAFHALVVQRMQDSRLVATDGNWGASTATLSGNIDVGWVHSVLAGKTATVAYLFVQHAHKERLADLFREELWNLHGSNHLVLEPDALAVDKAGVPSGYIQTAFIEETTARIKKFLPMGIRAYALCGLPGVGKTTCICQIVKAVGLRSLRIPLLEVCAGAAVGQVHNGQSDQPDLTAIVVMLQPDVIVLDDLDRAPPAVQDQLLDFIDRFRKTAKIILVSVNDIDSMDAALTRTDRLDDHLIVPSLGAPAVAQMLGAEAQHADRMADWPISFIHDYLERVEALGSTAAAREIDGLEARVRIQRESILKKSAERHSAPRRNL